MFFLQVVLSRTLMLMVRVFISPIFTKEDYLLGGMRLDEW